MFLYTLINGIDMKTKGSRYYTASEYMCVCQEVI